MKKIIGMSIILMLIIPMCGCLEKSERPNPVVTKVSGAWSEEYDAFFVDVFVYNHGGNGNVNIGVTLTQDGQTFNHFSRRTVTEDTEVMEHIRCGDIKRDGGEITYRGWVQTI